MSKEKKDTEANIIPSWWVLSQVICLLVDYTVKKLPFWLKWFPSIILISELIITLSVIIIGLLIYVIIDK